MPLLCFISLTRLTPSPSLQINLPYAADRRCRYVTSQAELPLTSHLSLFQHLCLKPFTTSLLLSFILFTRVINPFLSCTLLPLFSCCLSSLALINCTNLSHSCTLNALSRSLSPSATAFLSRPPSYQPISASQTPLLN